MKNKNIFHFAFGGFSAKEKRMLMQNPSAAPDNPQDTGQKPPEVAKETTRDKAIKLTQELYQLSDLKAARIYYEGNPFREKIDLIAKSHDEGTFKREITRQKIYEAYTNEKTERRKKNPWGTEIDYEFLAIEWPHIKDKLDRLFEGKGVTRELIEFTLEHKNPAFMELLLALADKKAVSGFVDLPPQDPIVLEALSALDKERPEFNKPGVIARIHMQGKIEREKMKPLQLPMEPPMNSDVFTLALDSAIDNPARGVDKIAMPIGREGGKINSSTWDTKTKEGLEKIMFDFKTAGIPVTGEFYQSMFANLYWGIDETRNPYLKDTTERGYFLDPENNLKNLAGLGGKAGDFAKAYEHYIYVRNMMSKQSLSQVETLTRGRDLDSDVLATKSTDFLKKNYNKFMKAMKERDYATAGLYVVGIWALYTSLDNLGVLKKDKGAKWLAYGLAAYCGFAFAKNAGYDVLKMAGFQDVDYDLKGTPLGSLRNILGDVPEFEEIRDDPQFFDVTLRMSEVSLADLDRLFQESNEKGVHFIHPKEFSKIFKEECKVGPFKIGIGENGLEDYSGMSNQKLSRAQQEYLDKGRQIYSLAWAMRTVYERTLMLNDTNYKGKTYEDGILNDSTRQYAKVRHLLGAVEDYAPREGQSMFKPSKTVEEADKHLSSAFGAASIGYSIEKTENPYQFSGYIQKYPVMFVRVGDEYRVYLKEKFGTPKMPGDKWLVGAEIPIKGGDKSSAAKKVHEGIVKRLEELLKPLRKEDPDTKIYSDIKYDGRSWTCEVTFPPAPGLLVKPESQTATITPFPNGKGVEIEAVNGFWLSLDESASKQRPLETAIIWNLMNQDSMKGLHPFSNAGKLHISEIDPQGKFTIEVGDSRIKAKMKVEGEKVEDKKYVFASSDAEKTLVSSAAFADEYVNAINGDDKGQFNKTIADLKGVIKHGVDESQIIFFFKSLFGQVDRGHLSGVNTDIFSGSKPELFTAMVIDATKEEAMQKLRASIKGKNSMAEVEKMRQTYLQDVNDKLQAQISQIGAKSRALQAAGEDWSREDFRAFVIDPIRRASSISNTYAEERSRFEAELYGLSYAGIANMSDYNNTAHAAVGKLLGIYAYHTAHLDTKKLGDITWPANSKEEGHYILNYLDYVKTQILNGARQMASGDGISVATIHDASSPKWGIEDYKSWKEHGTYNALDPLDDKDRFKHDAGHHDKHFATKEEAETELDKELRKELKEAKKYLEDNFKINPVKLDAYFNAPVNKNIALQGLFRFRRLKSTENASGNYIYTCKMWKISDRIARSAGGRRSVQIRLIKKEVASIIDEILRLEGMRIDEPGVWDKLKDWWRLRGYANP